MAAVDESAALSTRLPTAQSAAIAGGLTSAGLADKEPVDQSEDVVLRRPIDESTALSGGPHVVVTLSDPIYDTTETAVEVGTAAIDGAHIGTPEWSLEDDASGKYVIDSSTGVITVDDELTAGEDEIEIKVTGVTPAVPNLIYTITVLEYPTIEVTLEAGITADAGEGDPIGQAVLKGDYTGTPVWSLSGTDAASYAIDADTGAITAATSLSQGTDEFDVEVAGVEPEVDPEPVEVTVGAGA